MSYRVWRGPSGSLSKLIGRVGATQITAGHSAVAQTWTTAATLNNLNSVMYNSSGRRHLICRIPYYIGSGNRSRLKLAWNGWRLVTTTGYANLGYNVTIEGVYLEHDGVQSIQMTFDGGTATTKVIAPGDNDIQTDPISASAFGVSSFAKGERWLVRVLYSTPSNGNGLPYAACRDSLATGQGGQYWWYVPGSTNITNGISGTGFLTQSGTAADSRSTGYCPVMLGEFVTGQEAYTFVGIGSSTMQGESDTKDYQSSGGFYNRVMGESYHASLNWAASGISNSHFQASPNVIHWLRYASVLVDGSGAGSVDGVSQATIQNSCNTFWSYFKQYGGQKIIRVYYNPRTSSTDSFATLANQTINSQWGVGEKADLLNQWFETKVSDNTIDATVKFPTWYDATEYRKWAVTGAANYATSDGTHARPNRHTDAVTVLASAIAAL